jgi:hypothetical protein
LPDWLDEPRFYLKTRNFGKHGSRKERLDDLDQRLGRWRIGGDKANLPQLIGQEALRTQCDLP